MGPLTRFPRLKKAPFLNWHFPFPPLPLPPENNAGCWSLVAGEIPAEKSDFYNSKNQLTETKNKKPEYGKCW